METKTQKQLTKLQGLSVKDKTALAKDVGIALSTLYSYINGNGKKFDIADKIINSSIMGKYGK
jgi:hypothetical protein